MKSKLFSRKSFKFWGLAIILLVIYCWHFQGATKKLKREVIIPVLAYHHVKKNPDTSFAVSPQMLERHLSYLRDNGFQAVSLDELYAFLKNHGKLPPKPIMLTFDDGWENVLRNAVPLLKKYGFKASFFIYPSVICAGDTHFMSLDELRNLEKEGFDVQSHTWSHLYFEKECESKPKADYLNLIRKELNKSRNWLEKKLNKKIEYLAYPYGYYDNDLERCAATAGYKLMLTTSPGVNDKYAPPGKIRRQTVCREDTFRDFVDMVEAKALKIKENCPADGACVKSDSISIFAVLSKSNVFDPSTLKLKIDLKNGETFFDPGTRRVSARPCKKLSRGFHCVFLKASDKNNRILETSWSFVVRK